MSVRLMPLLSAVLAAGMAHAQNACPKTKAVEVPARTTLGVARACDSGFRLDVQGVSLQGSRKECPLCVVVTPTHHEAVATKEATFADNYAVVSEQIVYFDCTPHWFLLFNLNSTCDLRSIVNASALPLMTTKGCIDTAFSAL